MLSSGKIGGGLLVVEQNRIDFYASRFSLSDRPIDRCTWSFTLPVTVA